MSFKVKVSKLLNMEESSENPEYIVEDAAKIVFENITDELRSKFSIDEIIVILDTIAESMEKVGLTEDEKATIPSFSKIDRSVEVDEDVLANYVISGCKEKNISLTFDELQEIYDGEMVYYKNLGLLMDDDIDLSNAFEIILSTDNFSDYINEIASLICENALTRESLNGILKEYKIKNIGQIKEELLDLIFKYINIILNDYILSQKELGNIKFLKNIFSIKEGEFYDLRYDEVEEILHRQFSKIY